MGEENEDMRRFIQAPLSDIWRELLGDSPSKIETAAPDEELLLLKSDPWSELLQTGGVEIINVQQVQMHLSDRDVEMALQIMQEDPTSNGGAEQ